MKKNVGNIDLAVRLIIAALIAVLIFAKVITGTWIVVSAILTLILVLTGFVRFCPLYSLIGVNTKKG